MGERSLRVLLSRVSPMRDPRWNQLADHLVGALKVTRGDTVSVFMTDVSAMPAVKAFVNACYQRGATPEVVASDESFDASAIVYASDEALEEPSALELSSMERADVHVSFRGMAAPESEPDHRKAALLRKSKGLISTKRWENTRWCLVRIPTEGWAAMIGAEYDALVGEFFDGCFMDWTAMEQKQLQLCESLTSSQRVRVRSDDTDITFGVAGRAWISFAGGVNLPDGEIATAPVDDSTEGFITFPDTIWFAGVKISGLRLEFQEGRVSSFHADHGEEFVRHILATDEGASRIGELGIGTNPHVSTYTGDLLLDEKILGTMHLALGRAYPECGGVNRSAIHWDLVKDLRTPAGLLSVDSEDLLSGGKPTGLLAGFEALRA
jgi:aminopeptidase